MNIKNSKKSNRDNENHHDIIWNLLPWFVNNTLEHNEHKQVEQHLSECTLCQKELQTQRYLQSKLSTGESTSNGKINAFKNIMQRIDTNEIETQQTEKLHDNVIPIGRLLRNVRKYKFSSIPSSLAASFLVAITLGLFLIASDKEKTYTTLSDSQPNDYHSSDLMSTEVIDHQYLTRVIFDEKTTDAEIKSILDNFKGTVLAGPDSRGIYTIDFSKAAITLPQYQALLVKLKQHPTILLASAITKTNIKK